MADKIDSRINRYKSYITAEQRRKLRDLYAKHQLTTADERREAYLEGRRAMASAASAASAMGLGSGYLRRVQREADASIDKYSKQLDATADQALMSDTVTEANKTIKARNEAAKAAAKAAAAAARRKREAAEKAAREAAKEKERSRATQPRFDRSAAQALIDADKAAGPSSVPPTPAPPVNKPNAGGNRADHSAEQAEVNADRSAGLYQSIAELRQDMQRGTADYLKPDFSLGSIDPYQTITVEEQELLKDPESVKRLGADYQSGLASYQQLMGRIAEAQKSVERYNAAGNELASVYQQYQYAEQIFNNKGESPARRKQAQERMQACADAYNRIARYMAPENITNAEMQLLSLCNAAKQQYAILKHQQLLLYTASKAGADPLLAVTGESTEDAYNRMWVQDGNELPQATMTKENGETMSPEEAREAFLNDPVAYYADILPVQERLTGGNDTDASTLYYEGLALYKAEIEYQLRPFDEGYIKEWGTRYAPTLAKFGNLRYRHDVEGNTSHTAYQSLINVEDAAKIAGEIGVPAEYLTKQTLEELTYDDVQFMLYLIATHRKDELKTFLYNATSEANEAEGRRRANNLGLTATVSNILGNKYGWLKPFGEATSFAREEGWQLGYGYTTFGDNIANLFKGYKTPPSVQDYQSGSITQNQVGRGYNQSIANIVNSSAVSIGNMLPSIALSYVGGGAAEALGASADTAGKIGSAVGSASLGISAAGGAYMEALRQGYSRKQAYLYGALNGASEAALQSVMGGIIKLGSGGLAQRAIEALTNRITKTIPRIVVKYGLEMVSEFSEEYLQEVLEPVFRNLTLGEHNEVKFFSQEALEAGIAGALTAALMNSASIRTDVRSEQYRNMGIDDLMQRYGYNKADATFMWDTKAAMESGDKLTEKQLKRFSDLGYRMLGKASNEAVGDTLTVSKPMGKGRLAQNDVGTRFGVETPSMRESVTGSLVSDIDTAKANYYAGKVISSEASPSTSLHEQINATDHTSKIAHMTDEAKVKYLTNAKPTGKTGNLYYTTVNGKAITRANLTAKQQQNYNVMLKAARAFKGTKFVVHDTLPLVNGCYVDGNGTVHVALDATNPAASVVAHEISHKLKADNPEAYAEFVKAAEAASTDSQREEAKRWVEKYYGEKVGLKASFRYDDVISEKNADVTDAQKGELQEEYYARLAEKLYTDDSYLDRIIESDMDVEHKRTILQTIRDTLEKLWNAVKDVFMGSKAKDLINAKNRVTDALARLNEGETKKEERAEENVPASAMVSNTSEGGRIVGDIEVDNNGNVNRLSIRTTPQTEKGWDSLVNDMVAAGYTEKQAKTWIDDMRSVAAEIMDAQEFLDYENDPRSSWFRKNAEYTQGTIDFSNNCPRRAEFTAQFDALMKQFPNFAFTAEDYETIRTIIKDAGIAVTCGGCYVEERRQHLSEIGQLFLDKYHAALNGETGDNALAKKFFDKISEEDKKYDITLDDIVSSDSLRKLYDEHPTLYKAFNNFNNARGMAAARLVYGLSEYNNQIQKWNKGTITRKNNLGGLRIFSYSDADPRIILDVMQIITDSASKGLMMQGYTKKPWFAAFMKNTGARLLRSHIPMGTGYKMVKGQMVLDFDNFEGISTKDKYYSMLDRDTDLNIGNNVIGINDTQIRLAMVSDIIDQIIPFHTGLKKSILHQKKLEGWNNYRDYQTDKAWTAGDNGEYKWRTVKKGGINLYTDIINAIDWSKTENHADGSPMTDAERFVNKYLDLCREKGFKPRFAQFLCDENGNELSDYGDDHFYIEQDGKKVANPDAWYTYNPGYEKFLVDFRLFDKNGKIIEQNAVAPNFDNALVKKLFSEYIKENPQAKPMDKGVQAKIADAMKEKYGDELTATRYSLRATDAEYLSLAAKYRDGTATEEEKAELEKMVKAAAKKAGYNSPKLYHGTRAFGFTVFKNSDTGAYFFTDRPETASTYSGKETLNNVNEKVRKDRTGSRRGNYSVYLRTDKLLTVDCMFRNWDDIAIDAREVDRTDGRFYGLKVKDGIRYSSKDYTSTNDIVTFAKEKGYDGVVFRNLRDNSSENPRYRSIVEGGKGEKLGASDVYAVFDASQIKSADPVTYDDDGNIIPLSERFNAENEDIRFSMREIDDAYMKAVEDGDEAMQERIIEEAAKSARYKKKVYHGTRGERFNIFDFSKDQRGNRQMFFSSNRKIAETYGHRVMSLYINTDNFLTVDANGDWWTGFEDKITKDKAQAVLDQTKAALQSAYYDAADRLSHAEYGSEEYTKASREASEAWDKWNETRGQLEPLDDEYISGTTYSVANKAREMGYAGLIIKRVVDTADTSVDTPSTVYVIFDSNRVKSADLITRDDDGNIILPSERFRTDREGDEAWKNDDIRYQLRTASETEAVPADVKASEVRKAVQNNGGKVNGYDVAISYDGDENKYTVKVTNPATNKTYASTRVMNDTDGVERTVSNLVYKAKTEQYDADIRTAERMHEGARRARELRRMEELLDAEEAEHRAEIKKLRAEAQNKIDALEAEYRQKISDARLAERMAEGAIRAEERAKAQERFEKLREEKNRKIEEVRAQYRARIEKIRTERLRRELKDSAMNWNKKLVKMLANPTENSHIPVQLAKSVIEFTSTLTEYMDGNTKRGQAMLAKLKNAYEKAFRDEGVIERARTEDENYDPRGQILNSEAYDEALAAMMAKMDEIVNSKAFGDLTANEMEVLRNITRGVVYTINNANKMIGETEGRAIWDVGSRLVDQMENAPKVSNKLKGYLESSLDLRRLARIFNGSDENAELVKLVEQLNDGAIEKERIAQELADTFKAVTDKYGDEIRKWYGKKAEWIDTGITVNGEPVRITKGMRVSLAMHVLNEGNMRHIENGGLTIPDKRLYDQGKLADAYANGKLVRLTADQIADIIADMTEAEKAYLEAAKEFFHENTGYYVNKTSLALLGYSKAIVDNYFPIHTDKNFTKTDFASMKMDGSIEGQGFLKERVIAKNPVYLEDITSVVNRQIRGVSLYAGLAIPMRNFNSVMNAGVYEDVDGMWVPRTTAKGTLTKKMGAYGAKTVEGFLTDVSEMSHVDVSPAEKLVGKLAGNYVKAVLLGNLKVAMKQVASYPTAAAVIPWKYLGKALMKGGRKGRVISRADVDLINRYTPLYRMRQEGNANEVTSISHNIGIEQKLPWLLGWITKMDVMTVGRLWSAAEYMVSDQQKNLTKGTDEYYKAVAKVFNDTIQQTQPNFTPLQRSAALRSKNPIVRSLTLFGTQRMQNGGILIEAAAELMQSKGKSAEQIAAARNKLGRAVASQVTQGVLLLIATLAVDALRGRMRAWQDDDDELTMESIMSKMGDTFLSNFVGSFLGGSELYSAISGLYKTATGKSTYDTEFSIPALDAVETIINFAQSDVPQLFTYLTGDHTDEEKKNKLLKFSYALAKAFGYATGIPLENALKDVFNGLIPAWQDIKDYKKSNELIPWLHQSGKLDSAKTRARYEEWLDTGHKGSTFFEWDKKLKGISKRDDRISLLSASDLSNEDKALLMALYDNSDGYSEGAIFYNKNGKVIVDFANTEEETPAEETVPEAETPAASSAPEATASPYAKKVEQAVARGIPADIAEAAFEQYASIAEEKDEDKAPIFREWLDSQKNLDGVKKLQLLAIAGNDSWLKKSDEASRTLGITANSFWTSMRYYETHGTYTDSNGKEISRGRQYQQYLDGQNMTAKQRFAMLEYANASSSWYEKSEEAYTKGIGYEKCWKVAMYAAGESGRGKSDRIKAYARSLGLTAEQAKWLCDKFS